MAASGQTMMDRLLSAKHSIAGQGLAKAVCKATTEELIPPKKKHLDCNYFLYYHINDHRISMNVLMLSKFYCPLQIWYTVQMSQTYLFFNLQTFLLSGLKTQTGLSFLKLL